jgi:putative phospholipid/glycerol acyltransferase
MLTANHHRFIYPFFQYYTEYQLKRRFHSVQIIGDFEDRGLPVLLIANHIGWWDGFWAMHLMLKVLHRKFYFMMQEDQLLKYRFFNQTGAFSVRKSSRETLQSLSYASSLLEDSSNMVLIYPQGQLHSLYNSDFHFQRGLGRLIEGREGKLHLILSANMIDYGENPRPSLSTYIKEYQGAMKLEVLEEGYNVFYRSCLSQQINRMQI